MNPATRIGVSAHRQNRVFDLRMLSAFPLAKIALIHRNESTTLQTVFFIFFGTTLRDRQRLKFRL